MMSDISQYNNNNDGVDISNQNILMDNVNLSNINNLNNLNSLNNI